MDHEEDIIGQLIGVGGGESRSSEYTGTKALMAAVLEDGIRDYCDAVGRRCTEAEDWVMSNRRGVFSFAVVCETLALDPSAVRRALVRLKNQSGLPHRRIRPEVSRNRPTAKIRVATVGGR